VTNYVSNDVNEYTSTTTNGVTTTYQYDANGNLISATSGGQTTTYTFNALNQLTGVSGPNGTFSYTYDPLGYQISSTVNGQTINDLIDPFGLGNVAAQFNSSGKLVAEYTYGLGLVSQVTASDSAYYYDYNLQGSTVGITNSAGAYVNQYTYDPFGHVTTVSAGIANPFTFVGQDGVSRDGNGLVYMRNRYYDPSTGLFESSDPEGLLGGSSNLRSYGKGDPIGFVDPSGLQEWPLSPCDKDFAKQHPFWHALFRGVEGAVKGAGAGAVLGFGLSAPTLFATAPETILGGIGLGAWTGFVGGYGTGLYEGFSKDDSNNGPGCNSCDPPPSPSPPAPTPPGPPGPKPPPSNNQPPRDPNDLLGPSGYGSAGYLTPGGALPYTIEFSNEKTAKVPADNVVVTEQLSPNLDWSTFQLGTIGFGNYVVNVPPGLTSYSTRVDATATLGVYVDVDASLNLSTGLLTVTFTSLDPTTLDTPSNRLVGFLPPDTNPPNGEGYINYTIQPKPGLVTGAAIDAQASIVFDTNAPLATPQVVNTIDAGPPTSTVTVLSATTTTPSFTVSWSGSDGDGPGIAGYDVYVSDDGGPFSLWQSDTSATSATYPGQPGHTYAFYSTATDHLGLVQPTPTSAQATIQVINTPTPTPTQPPPVTVQSVQVETIKAGKGKKAKKETVLVLSFSGALNPNAADNPGAYGFAPIIKPKGKHKPPGTRLGTLASPASAVYDSTNDTVTLTPRGKLKPSKPEELIVDAALLSDTLGRPIDGGGPGGDFIATIRGSRVTPGGLPLARTLSRPVALPAAIDALLARGELAGLRLAFSTRRESRMAGR
jgi:RHS repeat-associated protein